MIIDTCLVCGHRHAISIICPNELISLEQHTANLAAEEVAPCPACAVKNTEIARLVALVEKADARCVVLESRLANINAEIAAYEGFPLPSKRIEQWSRHD